MLPKGGVDLGPSLALDVQPIQPEVSQAGGLHAPSHSMLGGEQGSSSGLGRRGDP